MMIKGYGNKSDYDYLYELIKCFSIASSAWVGGVSIRKTYLFTVTYRLRCGFMPR